MVLRNEYPRPQFVRENWENLNGEWDFAFDDHDVGMKEKWYEKKEKYDRTIIVPFVYQSVLSGIGDRRPHDIVWYQREFEVERTEGQLVILHLGAVDYEADVFINGKHVCNHIGGHTSFEADITDYLREGKGQTVCIRARDPQGSGIRILQESGRQSGWKR